jgi:hypothetical protein
VFGTRSPATAATTDEFLLAKVAEAVRVPDGSERRSAGIQGDPEDTDWLDDVAAEGIAVPMS